MKPTNHNEGHWKTQSIKVQNLTWKTNLLLLWQTGQRGGKLCATVWLNTGRGKASGSSKISDRCRVSKFKSHEGAGQGKKKRRNKIVIFLRWFYNIWGSRNLPFWSNRLLMIYRLQQVLHFRTSSGCGFLCGLFLKVLPHWRLCTEMCFKK